MEETKEEKQRENMEGLRTKIDVVCYSRWERERKREGKRDGGKVELEVKKGETKKGRGIDKRRELRRD